METHKLREEVEQLKHANEVTLKNLQKETEEHRKTFRDLLALKKQLEEKDSEILLLEGRINMLEQPDEFFIKPDKYSDEIPSYSSLEHLLEAQETELVYTVSRTRSLPDIYCVLSYNEQRDRNDLIVFSDKKKANAALRQLRKQKKQVAA